jgi:hypothetical protein
MQPNSFKLKRYLNNVGFYATIDLEVNIESSCVLNIKYDETFVDEEWYSSLDFALRYVYEHYSKSGNKGLSVFVKKLHTMTGDTSQMVVVYVAIRCLCEVLGFTTEKLIMLDEQTGRFILAK